MVKASAAEKGFELRSHGELHSFILRLEKGLAIRILEGFGNLLECYIKTSIRTCSYSKWLKRTLKM